MIPHFESCLICEVVREELYGKLSLLGFFGVCPNVEIGLGRLDQPAALTFLFFGGPGAGTYEAMFDVFDEQGQRVVSAAVPNPFTADPESRTVLAVTLVSTFWNPGQFAIRCFVNDTQCFHGQFRVIHRMNAK